MLEIEKAPRAGGAFSEMSSAGCLDYSENSPPRPNTQIKFQDPAQAQNLRSPRAAREAKLELLREAVHEACAFIRFHAEACQSLAEAGDDAGLIHSIGRIVLYTKHAARSGNDLRAIRDESASNKEGGQ